MGCPTQGGVCTLYGPKMTKTDSGSSNMCMCWRYHKGTATEGNNRITKGSVLGEMSDYTCHVKDLAPGQHLGL